MLFARFQGREGQGGEQSYFLFDVEIFRLSRSLSKKEEKREAKEEKMKSKGESCKVFSTLEEKKKQT